MKRAVASVRLAKDQSGISTSPVHETAGTTPLEFERGAAVCGLLLSGNSPKLQPTVGYGTSTSMSLSATSLSFASMSINRPQSAPAPGVTPVFSASRWHSMQVVA